MTVKVGLIGAGGFGNIHLQSYAKNPKSEIIAISSRTKRHAENAAQKYLIDKVYFGDEGWKSMLKSEELDAVSICAPNYLHAPMAIESLHHGIHVLCEKPICTTSKELEDLEQAVSKTNLIFFTSFQKRFNPLIPVLKKIITDQILGKILLVKYYFSHYGPYTSWKAVSEQKWFFDSELAGGGVLLDLGVHCIDILCYLIGDYKRIDGINSNTSCIDMKDEDNCNVLFRFQNDTLGIISVSWCNHPSEIIDIYGIKGNLRVDLRSKRPVSCQPKTLKKNKFIKNALSLKSTSNNYQERLINHFINAIIKNVHSHPNFEDGKKSVEFILDAYATLKRGQSNFK